MVILYFKAFSSSFMALKVVWNRASWFDWMQLLCLLFLADAK